MSSQRDAFEVSLNLASYEGIIVYGKSINTPNANTWAVYVPKDNSQHFSPFTTASASYAMGRNITVTNAKVSFSRGATNLSEHVNYNECIPTYVYGVK